MAGMKNQYKIKFSSLKTGIHSYKFEMEDAFFESYEYSQIEKAKIVAHVQLEKLSTMMILNFDLNGMMDTICDRCTDPIQSEISFQDRLIVKYGDETSSTEEEILVLGPAEFELDLSQYLYEYSHLGIPSKSTHQNDDDCNQEILDRLYYSEDNENDKEEDTDPRWDQLKKLK